MSEKDHYRFGLSRRGKNVNDNNTLADDLRERIRELEAENKKLREQLATELVYGPDRSTSGGNASKDDLVKRYVYLGLSVGIIEMPADAPNPSPYPPYVLAADYDALAAELARCRAANVYDANAHQRVSELKAALEAIANGEGAGGLAETERLQEIARAALTPQETQVMPNE